MRSLVLFAAVLVVFSEHEQGVAASVSPPAPERVASCGQRAESGRKPFAAPPRADLIGPFAFFGGTSRLRLHGWEGTVDGQRLRMWKAPVIVRAGSAVTLAVPQHLHGRLFVNYAVRPSLVSAIRFEPCRPSQRAFSYDGTIGRYTAWAGALLAVGPLCAEVEVWVEGRARPFTGRFPLGAARCP